MRRRQFGQTEIQNLCVAARSDKQIGGLDVAMNNSGGVRGVQPLGNLPAPLQQRLDIQWTPANLVLQRHSVQKFHGDEPASFELINFVNSANVGMV
jgi:hypothetical protein